MIARKDPAGSLACWRARRALQAYLDGVLEDATARRVARHVQDCPRCASEAETYQAIKNSLGRRQRRSSTAVQRLRNFGETMHDEPRNEPGE